MSEQASKVENEAIPQWADGLYHAKGFFSEALVYRDDEALYIEHRGEDSAVVCFPLEMLQTLSTAIEANEELSQE
jgi:hypothetical protein